jgi:hypothetical protein
MCFIIIHWLTRTTTARTASFRAAAVSTLDTTPICLYLVCQQVLLHIALGRKAARAQCALERTFLRVRSVQFMRSIRVKCIL